MTSKYLVVFEKAENGYSAYVPDMPGCVATAETLIKAEELIREGLALHVEGIVEDGQPIPLPESVAKLIDVRMPECAPR